MKSLIVFIVFVVGALWFLRVWECRSLFYPVRPLAATPEAVGLAFEDVTLTTPDRLRLHGWLIPSPGAVSTLIFLHGNAGNIGDRLGKIMLFHQMGLNVLIFDYRGYGRSEGRPSEQGLYTDAAAAYDYVRQRADLTNQKIIIYGASLGGAVAVDLAFKRTVSALIVDSTFTSVGDMARQLYPFLPSFLIRSKFDSLGKVKDILAPKLFIHSVEDEIVPYAMGQKLFEAAAQPKTWVAISGTHNEGYLQDEHRVESAIKDFLQRLELIR